MGLYLRSQAVGEKGFPIGTATNGQFRLCSPYPLSTEPPMPHTDFGIYLGTL